MEGSLEAEIEGNMCVYNEGAQDDDNVIRQDNYCLETAEDEVNEEYPDDGEEGVYSDEQEEFDDYSLRYKLWRSCERGEFEMVKKILFLSGSGDVNRRNEVRHLISPPIVISEVKVFCILHV